jgi:hypothetical protein
LPASILFDKLSGEKFKRFFSPPCSISIFPGRIQLKSFRI